MTDNPFEALGGAGGFDLQGLLQQAQQMQEQLESAQEALADARIDGTVAGGAVTVTVNGIGELPEVKIKAGGFDGSSDDDLSDLGDLIVAAYRDAKTQADTVASSALGPLSGGMPGLGGPDTGPDSGPDTGPGPDSAPGGGPASLGFSQGD
jgi:DNA-binding YbaB/EbfC family protein